MKVSERVLNENGQFEAFPERILKRAIETEARPPIEDAGEPDPNLPRGNNAQAEVKGKQAAQAKAQKEHNKKKPQTAELMLAEMPAGVEKDDVVLPRKNKSQATVKQKE